MAGDHKYYYDFSSEISLSIYNISTDEKKARVFLCADVIRGNYILLCPADY